MVYTVQNPSFFLPAHFLTDGDDLLSDNIPPFRRHQPVNNHDDNDNELLAELTRYLTRSSLNHSEKGWGYATSPKSTLYRSGFSSNGSPTGPSRFPSPPLTPTNQNDAAFELLYEAAASVARLNLNHHHHHFNTSTTLALPRHHPQRRGEITDYYCHHHRHNHQQSHRSYGVPGWGPQRGRQQHAHVYTQRRAQEMTTVHLGGSGVKKRSLGTGVFIPRRADSGTHQNQPEISITATARKKGSGCSTVLLPTTAVQASNLDVDEMRNGGVNYNNTPKRILTDHEILTARRNEMMSMERGNGRGEGAKMVGHKEIGLPSDWTY